MSDTLTNVVGYFNPHSHPIYLEISDLNIKVELPPGKYIMDTQGNLLNDPVFEAYCHAKGLSKATTEQPVPIRLVPRMVRQERPAHAVTQATGFVRQPNGTVMPVYDRQPMTQAEAPVNKIPIIGMSVEKARQLGLIGKPRLVPEDYGADETTGAPERGKKLPDIKVSIESPPRIRTAAPLRPELMEASPEDLNQAQIAQRQQLQRTITTASAVSPDKFDPARVRPIAPVAPVPLVATDEPVGIVGATRAVPVAPVPVQPVAAVPVAPVPVRAKKATRAKVKTVVVETPAPAPAQAIAEEAPAPAEEVQPVDQVPPQGGMIQPMDEAQPGPVNEPEGRYVCAADGKPFKHRSELERYVLRKFPQMAEQLMAPYPPTQ